MITFRRPTDEQIRAIVARQPGQPWTYDWPEITRTVPAARRGWQIDHARFLLGYGPAVHAAACQALARWQMFPRHTCQVFWPDSPQQPGQVVAVLYRARLLGLWMLFPGRVVYAVDGRGDDRTFGFAYGTLPDHPERGEERFLIEWNRDDDSVWYDLLAFSRPGHWLARLGYPYARYEQARFRRLSGLAMQAAASQALSATGDQRG